MSELKGKTAIVTGASKGIGAGIARAYGVAGAAVVVNYASDKAGADRVVADIQAAGGRAVAVQGDVSKEADVLRLFDETEAAVGRPNVLVNNAGVYQFGAIEDLTVEHYRRQFDINVLGSLLAIREAAKRFGPEGGAVVNVSSVAGRGVYPTTSVYSATKAAVDHFTRVLAAELGPKKIRVNAVNPGGVETEGTHTAGVMGSEFERQMIASTPLGRLGQPDDIAKVAVFLASDAAGWVTGETLAASGGQR
ncbi:3-oxoacyl-[acyl-carrier protein] reductase [Methylopila capsulata]|uniref:3-oxoacyl-[acyl-carrier protein] reductase n=1 Tax=Methylopila capsulata TaxID=61654 RepID=A0A9W6MQH5_9HYPH|nr:glucose 1-dehydrogenase [Methylopila capsulata]MBM7851210.1 3-oxoacyl-[acyl-carrier protein] reductase [Methylopila capsulata]GLK54268.1 oxidoreductase [Methylopila capsulata]